MRRILITAALAAGLSTGAVMAQTPPPAAPAFTSPAEGSMLANVSIRWQGVSGASHYDLCLRESVTDPCVLERTQLSGTSVSLSPVPDTLRGKKIYANVRACAKVSPGSPPNCSLYNVARSFYVMGPVLQLQDPADGATYAGIDRRPTFSWPAYTGFHASSLPATLRYVLTITGTGAAPTVFQAGTATTFKLPTALSSQYQNPLRWGVRACTSAAGNDINCSLPGVTRTINLPGATPAPWGPVQLSSPANGSTVDTGSKLSWLPLTGAATYRVCLNTQATGCRLQVEVATGSSTPQLELTAAILDMRENPNNPAYVFRNAAGSPLKTMYWSVTACKAGYTQCSVPDTTLPPRTVLVANAPAGTTPPPPAGDPTLSFAQHLYPIIASPECGACHPVSNPPYYPQRLGPSNNPASSLDENSVSIPFSTADSASTMRSKFLGLVARSTAGSYSQALGKVYVVPGNSSGSGLHWKAQSSTAAVFSSNRSIGGQTKPLKEWIRIWIDQGAAP